MALRVVSSQTSTQIERNQAESDIEYPLRILAANLLRTVRGAGRPDELPGMMLHCLDVLEKYRKVVGHFPKAKVYRRFLNLDAPHFDPEKWADDREQEANKQLSMSGYPERIKGELMIHRGGLSGSEARHAGLLSGPAWLPRGRPALSRGHAEPGEAHFISTRGWRQSDT